MEYKHGELLHYGVLGMKWGRHIRSIYGNHFLVSRTFAKSMKHINRLKKSASRYRTKAYKKEQTARQHFDEAQTLLNQGDNEGYQKSIDKMRHLHDLSEKYQKKADKKQQKRERFENVFINTYRNVPYRAIKPRHLRKGTQFARAYLKRSRIPETFVFEETYQRWK